MKITKTIPQDLLKNEDLFQSEFYKRFDLRTADKPIKLTEKVSKDYKFPTFYGNVTCAMTIFTCSYKKAAKIVAENLHSKVKPVKMPRNRAVVAFSCYEYKNVLGVAPYNEIGVAIPVMVNTSFNPPILPMLLNSFSHFGYYIADMPVTSYENQLRGNNIWGLPKTTREVDIQMKNNECIVKGFESNGDEYIHLRIPTAGQKANFDVSSYLYSRLNGKLLRSETNFKADFNVNKNMSALFKEQAAPEKAYIKIGKTQSANIFNELEIDPVPFQTRFASGMESCFDLNNSTVPAWFNKLNS